jgi:hypothetical protein
MGASTSTSPEKYLFIGVSGVSGVWIVTRNVQLASSCL